MTPEFGDVLDEAVSRSAVVAAAQARVDRLRKLVQKRSVYAAYGGFTVRSVADLTAAEVALVAAVGERQRRVVAWLAHTRGEAHGTQ